MKKNFILSIITLAVTSTAVAEGYQVNTLSARQGGMGHTGVSQRLESESIYFNPAGMGFMDKTFSVSLSGTFLYPTCTASVYNADNTKTDYTTDNKVSTPLMATAAFSVNDNVKVGIGFYTPYGSNINWGNNWAGALLNQKVSL
ncbi:MAG: outer membrane protein transport protein, partial [Muribaculum sp.]|nr:outer membrane protein transport protein [Muribaculum sp.]